VCTHLLARHPLLERLGLRRGTVLVRAAHEQRVVASRPAVPAVNGSCQIDEVGHTTRAVLDAVGKVSSNVHCTLGYSRLD
jgi:hypothetical protein